MQSIELTKPVTTESLLTEFESRFNQTMDLSKFTREELEDTANKIRTRIHDITQNEHFGQELKNHDYQKNQSMLDIVNQSIRERQQTNEILPAVAAIGGRIAGGMAARAGAGKIGQAVATGAGQGVGQVAHDKIIEPIKQKLDKNLPLMPDEKKSLSKVMADKNVREGVEEQSELILAAKDMMDKVTGYLEDLATMKTESMLELADRIRDEMGAEKSDAFLQKVQPAIEQAEATLGTTRQELDNGVRILTGEEVATDPMGADDTMNMDDPDADLDDLESPETDEFGASDAEAGGTEPEGREQRESKEVFETSNRIYGKLAGK
jgi:outer membrane lipoprotein SlyB